VKKGKSTKDMEQFDQYVIPVINNQYRLLENQEEGYENASFECEHQQAYSKVPTGKKNSRRNGSKIHNLG
jgi:hypothetical protein